MLAAAARVSLDVVESSTEQGDAEQAAGRVVARLPSELLLENLWTRLASA